MYIVGCYASYLLISLAVTVWVARTLHKNGRIFLVDAFHGNAELADSVTISLRMDPRMLARIKRLARTRFLNYQSMIKQWLSERMEQEMRDHKSGARAQSG